MTKQYDNFASLITFTRASTGTYLDSDGLLKTATTNTPRIEFDINGNRKGILIEEARTNLLTYSEDFDNAAWTKSGTTVLANNTTGPFGGVTADRIVENTATSQHSIRQFAGVNYPDNSPYTASIYVKADGRSIFWIESRTKFPTFPTVYFDLANGAVLVESNGASGSIEHVGNGWYHCRLTANALTGAATPGFVCGTSLGTTFGSGTYEGDGVSNLLLWGAQLEAGSFPTSYIPTAGSTATRAADVASIPTSAFGYNAAKGTVVVDFETQFGTPTGFPRILEIGNTGTSINRVNVYVSASAGNVLGAVFSNNVVACNINTGAQTSPASGKIAFAFADDDFASVIDGGSPVTDTEGSFTTPSIPRELLKIGGSSFATTDNMSGHIKSLAYYPRKLTPAQLQRLTT